MKTLFIDMDNVLVNFQSGIDKLDEKTKARFKGFEDDSPEKCGECLTGKRKVCVRPLSIMTIMII